MLVRTNSPLCPPGGRYAAILAAGTGRYIGHMADAQRPLSDVGAPIGPAAVEAGLGVEVGEEGLEAGELGPHLRAQTVVDLDGLGDDLALPMGRPAGAELLAQLLEAVLGAHDGADLVEVEPHKLLELPDPAHA